MSKICLEIIISSEKSYFAHLELISLKINIFLRQKKIMIISFYFADLFDNWKPKQSQNHFFMFLYFLKEVFRPIKIIAYD